LQLIRKRHNQETHVNHDRWLLTYADLITLLLVFFVVMYSISKADDRKWANFSASLQKAFSNLVLSGQDATAVSGDAGGAAGDAITDDFAALRNDVLTTAQQMGLENEVSVTLQREGMAISLSSDLLFDSGQADLKPDSTLLIDQMALRLRGMPNEVRVEGHTDSIPIDSAIYPTNWELSIARATVVTRYLTEVGGIQPQRLSAVGYGEFRPVADNSTREGRALNRRVEILVVYPTFSED
jgi:chemotaxis protein MotB